ncbi:MAG TPA: hypothetical protein ENF37_00445, partial [Beggiatoa sp.]|nr:hypothetical protein [Beggiatoa sp.]
MNSRFSKKGLMVALGSSVFALSSFTAVHAGVCVLDFAKVEPAVSYDGYPNYFNSGSSHEHSITDKWNSVVVKRFLSCYQKTFPRLGMDVSRENCLEETVGETIHIWYPLPDGQDAKVTSAHWFEDAS